ncbi:unnamed protein product [Prorocentrum cordatum]|uniref:Uncharacterized protein n=1 Tax=Prorocentrum cordatum TaxID=2364126 RepID=A0ABN9R8G4_9DINO|nr:unnamed protein product [Polarella glacialis]
MLRHAGLIRIQCTCCTAAGGDTGQGVALYEHGRGQKSQEETERRRRRRRRTRGGGLVPLWLWMPRALAPRVDRKNAGRRCAGAAAAADPSKPRRVRENTGRSRGRRRTPREQRRGSAGAEACPTARGLPPSARVGLLLAPALDRAVRRSLPPDEIPRHKRRASAHIRAQARKQQQREGARRVVEQQQQEEKQGGPAREKTSRARCEAYNAALHRRYTFS